MPKDTYLHLGCWGAMGGLCAGKRQGQRWDVVGKDPGGREEAGMSPHWQVRVLSPYFLIVSGALWFLRLLAVIGFALSVSGGGVPSEGWGSHPLSLPTEGQGCTAYDVAVNSDFYRRMQVGGGAAGEAWAGASASIWSPPAASLSHS